MKLRGYQYKLDPCDEQATLFVQLAGVGRPVCNVALEQRRDQWRQFKACTGNSISYSAHARQLTMLREEFDWIRAVCYSAATNRGLSRFAALAHFQTLCIARKSRHLVI